MWALAIYGQVLHGFVRASVRFQSPSASRTAFRRCSAYLPAVSDPKRVRLLVRILASRGTCWTRALTLATVVPRSEVVIGVNPADATMFAHAWVESPNRRVRRASLNVSEIARLPIRASRPRRRKGERTAPTL